MQTDFSLNVYEVRDDDSCFLVIAATIDEAMAVYRAGFPNSTIKRIKELGSAVIDKARLAEVVP